MSINTSQPKLHAVGYQSLPVIDMSVIDELRSVGNNGELLQRVITLFGQHVPVSVAKISELVKTQDNNELADAVHALKSMCGSIGARRATAICEETEKLLRLHHSFEKTAGIQRMLGEVQLALEAIEQLRAA